MKPKFVKKLTYQQQKEKCKEFVSHFEDYDCHEVHQVYGRKKYLIKLQQIADDEAKSFEVNIQDLEMFFRKEEEKSMVESFKCNTRPYIDIFTHIAEELMPKREKLISAEEEIKNRFQNILKDQRRDNMETQNQSLLDARELIPISTHKTYDVALVYGLNSKIKIHSISQLNAQLIGSLVVCKAIVVRTSEIKPEIIVATFACDICGCENYLEVTENNYKPLDKCMSKKCIENKVSGKLTFLPGHSKFRPYQELKIQQTPDQLKQGTIPRTFTLQLKDSNVKMATPGDIILVQGVLLPNRRPGFKHQNDIVFDCHLSAFKIIREKKKYVEMSLGEEQIQEINSVRSNIDEDTLFNRLSDSIAPQIYGMEFVKKSLLLLMAGGVTKETHDNLRIRGEINIALIGDPGIAKSQLLKHISYLAPRAIYTTGKGSSGVGLTAAVVTDMETKQLCLEAGALVLADMGVCCIDQFDKMEEYDRTAIHEVMEQQTVSIAKAGITTTLNARTSILAAANPLYGRYNKKESAHKNINLPAALLSRFDLIFILLDTADKTNDINLAKHIGNVHRSGKTHTQNRLFDPNFIRSYIALAKNFNPTINNELKEGLIQKYLEMRHEQKDISKQGDNYTTTRKLLALIRLCQARAKLRFSNEVSQSDVAECLQIMFESQKNGTQKEPTKKLLNDTNSNIFSIIKEMCINNDKSIGYDIIRNRIISRGFTEAELEITIHEYMKLNVLMMNDDILQIIE